MNARIIALAALTELGLRTLPLGLLCRGYGIRIGRERGCADAPLLRLTERERAAVAAVERVYRWVGPAFDRGDGNGQGTCLRRALVCGALLRRRAPVLRLGCTRVAGRVRAHAWLELERGAAGGNPVQVERGGSGFRSLGTFDRAGAAP